MKYLNFRRVMAEWWWVVVAYRANTEHFYVWLFLFRQLASTIILGIDYMDGRIQKKVKLESLNGFKKG